MAGVKTCNQCAHFEPSKWNPQDGSGMCGLLRQKLEECKASGRVPNAKAQEEFYASLGGKFGTAQAIFWPLSDRDKCRRYAAK